MASHVVFNTVMFLRGWNSVTHLRTYLLTNRLTNKVIHRVAPLLKIHSIIIVFRDNMM